MKKVIDLLTVNKYYRMSDGDLEREAAKWKIGEYFDGRLISRRLVIEQLIERQKANNSRIAIFISFIALLISLVALLIP
ncbi:MAG: hypothetical protein WCT08_00650 [Patescibacteria group bacterium]|jgi:hypothetical protein